MVWVLVVVSICSFVCLYNIDLNLVSCIGLYYFWETYLIVCIRYIYIYIYPYIPNIIQIIHVIIRPVRDDRFCFGVPSGRREIKVKHI